MLLGQTFTVTNTLDDGSTGSLRWAINSANADIGRAPTRSRSTSRARGCTPSPWARPSRWWGPGRHRRLHPAGFLAEQPRRGRRRGPEDRAGRVRGGGRVSGLRLQASDSVVRGLVINRFAGNGIVSEDNLNVIAGNFIGTDPTGTIPRENGLAGILITGPPSDREPVCGDRNILSANDIGVQVLEPAVEERIQGTTSASMPPACIRSATTAVTDRHLLHHEFGERRRRHDGGRRQRDLGNANYGIHVLLGLNNDIAGNFIGTDATGMAAVGNGFDGVLIDNSSENTVQGNLISGNGRAGVYLALGSTLTMVVGNDIGTDAAGNPVLGNVSYGVYVASSGNQIGGTGPGQGNLIAGNGKGVVVNNNQTATELVDNQILGNSIYANATLGIDLGDDGPRQTILPARRPARTTSRTTPC